MTCIWMTRGPGYMRETLEEECFEKEWGDTLYLG